MSARTLILHDRPTCPACKERLMNLRVRSDVWLRCPGCKHWLFAIVIPPHMAAGYLAGVLSDVHAVTLLHALWPHHRQMPVMQLYTESLTIGSRLPKVLTVSATREEAEAEHFNTPREIIAHLFAA